MGEMQSPSDAGLLAEYAAHQSETAFAQLVARYVALVHTAALRQVGNPHLAEEITQAVFIILARKAGSLSNGGPRRHVALAGWLCRTAHLAACDALKTERRRQQRDRNAYLESVMNPTEAESQVAWQQIAPLLDAAVAQLGETDRAALVLRFYEQRPLEEVGAALGIGAAAAQKRVARVLEKLRKRFAKQGVALTGVLIASAVVGNSVQAAPVAFAKAISAVAVAKDAAASTSTLTLVKGVLKAMTWGKAKLAVGIVASLSLVVGVAVLTKQSPNKAPLTPREILNNSLAAYAAMTNYWDDGELTIFDENEAAIGVFEFQNSLGRGNLYRCNWKGWLAESEAIQRGFGENHANLLGALWCLDGQFYLRLDGLPIQTFDQYTTANSEATRLTAQVSTHIQSPYYAFNDRNGVYAYLKTMLASPQCEIQTNNQFGMGQTQIAEARPCYVLSCPRGKDQRLTIWIGQQDFLIRRVREDFYKTDQEVPALYRSFVQLHIPPFLSS